MDGERLDELIRHALGGSSRRGVLRAGLRAITGSALASLGLSAGDEGVAKKKRRKKKKAKFSGSPPPPPPHLTPPPPAPPPLPPSPSPPPCVRSCPPGAECGSNGCDGFCGVCPASEPVCANFACVCTSAGTCPTPASNATCQVRACEAGACTIRNGPNGQSGLNCTGPQRVCQGGTCVCVPNCTGKQCGTDGCDGSCGSCEGGESCSANGLCNCVADCAGKECGEDGCGGTCGACASLEVCQGGQCVSGACGIGAKICAAGSDAACCVAGHMCCPPGSGLNGCCGVDRTCCERDEEFFVDGGCCPPNRPRCCGNKRACCSEEFPQCCADTRSCCRDGDRCCSVAAGEGCCPAETPRCCPPAMGNQGFCCDEDHPVCCSDGTDPDGYCCPAGSVCNGSGGCFAPGRHVNETEAVVPAARSKRRARGERHGAAEVG